MSLQETAGEEHGKAPPSAFGWRSLFAGRGGPRAGWRLLIFLVLLGVLFGGFVLVSHGGPEGVRDAHKKLSQTDPTPWLLGGSDAISFIILCAATLLMGGMENRKFDEYGLPLRLAFEKDFWFGIQLGFGAISGTLLTMFLLHGFRIDGLAVHGVTILDSLFGWGAAFLMVGLFEEFLFRGYLQYTLASGIGFWPAAFVISGLFGLGHASNPNENLVGVVSVVIFGIILCLFLRRTGNLWCAVGFHAAYDWGQTLYGVHDSGIVPYHNLLRSTFIGSRWVTGGTVGPEASILTPVALVVVALVFSRRYRENRHRLATARSGEDGQDYANSGARMTTHTVPRPSQ